jgi:hypothetical protein
MATAVAARADAKLVTARDYIVAPLYDWLLILLPPVLALAIGISISGTPFADESWEAFGDDYTWAGLLIGMFIHAHLVIVFYRSHGNANIRQLYPFRFLAVPVLLWVGMMINYWFLIFISVLVTFWDVYHSALQTFGFARIYDRKRGNDPNVGRRLDWWLNQLLYAGPIVAGATMMDHFEDLENFDDFEDVVSQLFVRVPAYMDGYHSDIAWAVIAVGTAFVVHYLLSYWRLHRQGYQVSPLKVYLLASTGLVSVYTWGFNSFGEAFFIMNFFHALQYFGIVWAFEHKNMMKLFRVQSLRFGKQIALVLFILPAFGYGLWVEFLDAGIYPLWGITLVVSIMHFWYDGFVWSVRKQQV